MDKVISLKKFNELVAEKRMPLCMNHKKKYSYPSN